MGETSIGKRFMDSVEERLESVFSALEQERDVAPADLYGLEGFMAAGIELELVQQSELRERIIACAQRHFSDEVVELYRNDPELMLHMRMKRAPVYPST